MEWVNLLPKVNKPDLVILDKPNHVICIIECPVPFLFYFRLCFLVEIPIRYLGCGERKVHMY